MKTKIKNFFGYIALYIVWAITSAAGIAIMFVIRDGLFQSMMRFYAQDSYQRFWATRFFDKIYYVIAGMLWLAFVIVSEGYYKNSENLPKSDFLRRIARVLGIEVVIITSGYLYLYGVSTNGHSFQMFALLIGGLLIGVALVIYSIYAKRGKRTRAKAQSG